MELVFSVVKYGVLGFVGLIVGLVVLALVFGKRIIKKWEYEAEFLDRKGYEFGEFDIEMSRIEKDEPQFSFKASFRMRHSAFKPHKTVQVYLDDVLVLEGLVKKAGRVYLHHREHLQNVIEDAEIGQMVRIVCGSTELFQQPLAEDD